MNVSGKPSRRCVLGLTLLLMLGALVRFYGLGFGLPNIFCRPDELTLCTIALQFSMGDLNPHFFNYPSCYMYILYILFEGYYLLGSLTGHFNGLADLFAEFDRDPSRFLLISRTFSALCGVATLGVVYKIALRLRDRSTGLLAALFLSLAYLHVRDSHFGVTDIPVILLTTLSIHFILKTMDHPVLKNYLFAGLFAGLSTSTKYLGILLPAPMFLAAYLSLPGTPGRSALRSALCTRRMLVFLGALAFFFILGTPYALLDPKTFFAGFLQEVNFVMAEQSLSWLDRGWFFHLRFSLWHGLGWPLLIFGLIGIPVCLRAAPKKTLVLLAFPLLFYLITGKSYRVYVRYALPLVPVLCITASVCVMILVDRVSRAGRSMPLAFLVSSLLLLPSIHSVIRFDGYLAKKDSRVLAKEWVDRNLPKGATVYVPNNSFNGVIKQPLLSRLLNEYARKRTRPDPRMDEKISRLLAALNLQADYTIVEGKIDQNALPEFMILSAYPLVRFEKPMTERLERIIESHYQLQTSFMAIDPDNTNNLFDQKDAFYLPYAGFAEVQRPGPNLFIYARK